MPELAHETLLDLPQTLHESSTALTTCVESNKLLLSAIPLDDLVDPCCMRTAVAHSLIPDTALDAACHTSVCSCLDGNNRMAGNVCAGDI